MGKAVTLVNTPNKTQNFYPYDDKWEIKKIPMKASTAIEEGTAIAPEIVSNTTTGNYTKQPATQANGANFIGILAEPIVSTDADYATAGKLKAVWVPKTYTAQALFTVGAGTFTAIDIGKTVSFHTDSKSLAVDTQGLGAKIDMFISSTRGVCEFSIPSSVTA